jgi:MFS-type transporter involved in bile tolerance (Atg22 family)
VLGRVPAILLYKGLGVTLLAVMVSLEAYSSLWWVMAPVYIARTACMNCTYPLQESILMDVLPKGSRARWKSLESVAQFGWCGSAFLGGWGSDRHGYMHTFLLTACLQGSSLLLYLPLLLLVPRHEHEYCSPSTGADDVVSYVVDDVADHVANSVANIVDNNVVDNVADNATRKQSHLQSPLRSHSLDDDEEETCIGRQRRGGSMAPTTTSLTQPLLQEYA